MAALRTVPARLARHPVATLALLIAGLAVRLVVSVIDGSTFGSDAEANADQAYGFSVTGSYVEGSARERSMYREPLPVAAYAAQIVLDPRLDGVERDEIRSGGAALQALKQQHVLWSTLLLAGIALQAWSLVRRHRLLVASFAVVAVHAVFVEWVVNATLTELHAAAFVVWAGFLGFRWVTTGRLREAALLGLVLGAATLTKASVLSIGPVYLLILTGLILVRSEVRPRRVFGSLALVLATMAMVVMPWVARNVVHFDAWAVSDRGGLMLWMRSLYAEADAAESRGLWYVFAPDPLRPLVGRVVDVDEQDVLGPLRRINHLHPEDRDDPQSFYRLAREDRVTITDAYLAAGVPSRPQARVLADQDLMTAGLRALRSDPVAFLAQTPVFLWRGLWPVRLVPLVPVPILGLLNPLGMVVLLAAGLTAVVRRRPALFAVVGIPFGFVAFSALLTVYEPRSTEIAVPTMLLLLVVAAARAVERRGAARSAVAPAP